MNRSIQPVAASGAPPSRRADAAAAAPGRARAQASEGAVPVPLLAWVNALSLDAPAVAVAWQALFTLGFRGRWPRWHEAAALALAVWLIYVGDRLLDARRLDPSRPHLLRHRVHADHARGLLAAWAAAGVAACVLIWARVEPTLAAAGAAVAALALAHAWTVHGVRRRPRGVAKELRVGLVFAAGVSVACWREAAGPGLLAATALAGLLFAANCLVVSAREAGPGAAGAGGVAVRLLGVVLLGVSAGVLTGGLAAPLAAALAAGAAALFPLAWRARSAPAPLRAAGGDARTRFDPGAWLVDGALLAPPALAAAGAYALLDALGRRWA